MGAMTRLTLPDRHARILEQIAKLPDAKRVALAVASENMPSHCSYQEASSRFDDVVGSFGDADEFLSAVLSLHTLHSTHGLELDDIVQVVSSSDRLHLEADERERLRDLLSRILAVAVLRQLAKAVDLNSEHAHLFHTVRIITDIRPVFDDDASSGPSASTITHSLRLHYINTDDNDTRVFEVALTETDLGTVRQACDRALLKSGAIRATLSDANLRPIQTDLG